MILDDHTSKENGITSALPDCAADKPPPSQIIMAIVQATLS
jgi:hypothetical protein